MVNDSGGVSAREQPNKPTVQRRDSLQVTIMSLKAFFLFSNLHPADDRGVLSDPNAFDSAVLVETLDVHTTFSVKASAIVRG